MAFSGGSYSVMLALVVLHSGESRSMARKPTKRTNPNQKRSLAVLTVSLFSFSAAALANDILSRQGWGAAPAIEVRNPPIKIVNEGKHRVAAENKMPAKADAAYLTVHHSARPGVRTELKRNLKSFQSQMQNGYDIQYPKYLKHVVLGDIPYHYFIYWKGQVAQGRELRFAAYSNTTYRTPIEKHITVVLDGNFESDRPSSAQLKSLTDLLEHLAKDHHISLDNIGHHRAVAVNPENPGKPATACPGKNLIREMDGIKKELAKRGVS
jgi:hypothetical protein